MQPTQTWSVRSHDDKQQGLPKLQPPPAGLQVQNPNGEHVWPLQHGLFALHAAPISPQGGAVVGGVVVVGGGVVGGAVVGGAVVGGAQNSLAVPGFMHWNRRQHTSLPGVPQHVCCSSKTSQHS